MRPTFPNLWFSAAILAVPALLALQGIRSTREMIASSPFVGVSYRREYRAQPRPQIIHIVTVDLTARGVDLTVTPGSAGIETTARTTREFAEEFGVQIAINGSLFRPAYTNHPFDFYPRSGDPVDVAGLAISNAERYSDEAGGWPVLCIGSNHEVNIAIGDCPRDTRHALAGIGVTVKDGQAARVSEGSGTKANPRTAVAVSADGTRMFIVVVDGRLPFYSEGITAPELAELLIELGAYQGIELDGGGSSSLVINHGEGAELLNAPVHTGIPLRERPVANHLGIRARVPDA